MDKTRQSFDSPAPAWFVSMGEDSQTGETSSSQATAPQGPVQTPATVSTIQNDGTARPRRRKGKNDSPQPPRDIQAPPETPQENPTSSAAGQDAGAVELDTDWLRVAEDDSAVTIQRIGLGSSFVTLGAGFDVRFVKCGFDSCLIEMKNLPLDTTSNNVEEWLTQQDFKRRAFRMLGTQLYGDGSLRVLLLAHKCTAAQVATKLDGAKFKGNKIEFNVLGHNSLSSIQSIKPNILTVSWEPPPVTAILSYPDARAAHEFAEQLNKEGLGGHKLEAHVVPLQEGAEVGEIKVRTGAIPSGLNCFQLYSKSKAQSILIQTEVDLQDFTTSIRQFLGLKDTVQMFPRTVPCGGKPFGVLNITLNSWQSVKRACELLSGRKIKTGYPIVRCYLPFSKPIRSAVYIPLEPSFAHVWDSVPEQHRNDSLISSMHSNNGCIPPIDETFGDAKLEVRVEKLNSGKDKDMSYWHWAGSSTTFLHDLQTRLGVSLVEVCWLTRTLKLFAEDQATLDRALQLIRVDVSRSALVQQVITTDRRLIRSLQAAGALSVLKQKFGMHGVMSLDISPSQLMLKHRHSSSPTNVDAFLSKQKDKIETCQRLMMFQDDEMEASCPICLDDFSDAETSVHRLTCGHVYCTPCLQQFLVTAPERNKFPIACIGNEDRCRITIPIPVIQSLLSPQQFDTLVDKALSAYVEQRPEHYKYCPMPGCSQLYRCTKTTDGSNKGSAVATTSCPSCMLHLCTACHKPAHPELTCAERRERDPTEHDALNTEWASSNGAKRCPACQVWIQKMEGCNHVTCRCGAHICWICRATFPGANETYRHIRAAHPQEGMFYGVYVNGRRGPGFGGGVIPQYPPYAIAGGHAYPAYPPAGGHPGNHRINPMFRVPGMMLNGPGMVPNGVGMVPNGAGMMANGAGMVPNGAGMVPNGAGMMHNGAGMMHNGAGMMHNGAGMIPNAARMMPNVAGMMPNGAG